MALLLVVCCSLIVAGWAQQQQLRFDARGRFKILQVADVHYANGARTKCLDLLPGQYAACSDLNSTAFVERLLAQERPDLVVYTGDNIFASDTFDPAASLDAAFRPAVRAQIPWAAVLGNHDQESSLSRQAVMSHISGMKHTLSRVYPEAENGSTIDGFGNYNLQVFGLHGSKLQHKSVLNLYLLDSGDYSTDPSYPGYGWVKQTQQVWLRKVATSLQDRYRKPPFPQAAVAPAIAFFHIPLPEVSNLTASVGEKQERISCPSFNSGCFDTLVEIGDVKAVLTGHDHVNDFCGELKGVHLCYGGGFGYHAYGKAGWWRRARILDVKLEKTPGGDWEGVEEITTWKRLDDASLSTIDKQVLWTK